jgi:hypothetical protein
MSAELRLLALAAVLALPASKPGYVDAAGAPRIGPTITAH